MRKIFLSFLLLFLMCGCTSLEYARQGTAWLLSGESVSETESPLTEPVLDVFVPAWEEPPEPEEYRLIIEKSGYEYKKYEADGCYVGAYISEDPYVQSMPDFEAKALGHAIYAAELNSGDVFPENFAFECRVRGKTPLFVIKYNPLIPYDRSYIRYFAQKVGYVRTPVFVCLYPYSSDLSLNDKEYREFFSAAKEIFAELAPNIALVWSVSEEDASASENFYPGDENCDWVGIEITREGGPKADESSWKGLLNRFEYFLFSYQQKKPVMITSLAISHYSTGDNIYRTEAAEEEMAELYEQLCTVYTRVKAVVYHGWSELASEKTGDRNNYSLISETLILDSYREITGSERFLRSIPAVNDGEITAERFLSPFKAYRIEEKFFIPEKSLSIDLGFVGFSSLPGKTEINGEIYFPVEKIIERSSLRVNADDDRRELTIRK